MNLERLEQYRDLKREIETIKRRLADVKARATVQVCDTVQASETEFPYIPRTLPISGYSVKCTATTQKACGAIRFKK